MTEGVSRNSEGLEVPIQERWSNPETVMKEVAARGLTAAMQLASEELRANREFMMNVVSESGWALQFASAELRADSELVMRAVSRNGQALSLASEELRSDRDIVMKAVSRDWAALRDASPELQGDREIVTKAVSLNWQALSYASHELKADREVVLPVVSQHWEALMHASDELKGDREIVMKAVAQEWQALIYASEDLRSDSEIIAGTAWGSPPAGLVLKVALLSGRSCPLVFHVDNQMDEVLQECALALHLDQQHVASTGRLLAGTKVISSLRQLPRGQLHELTLVLSAT